MSGGTDYLTGGNRRKKPPSAPNSGFIVHRRAANGRIVTPKRRPMFEHSSLEEACDEADRLANLRGGTFSVFEVRYSARAPERPAPVIGQACGHHPHRAKQQSEGGAGRAAEVQPPPHGRGAPPSHQIGRSELMGVVLTFPPRPEYRPSAPNPKSQLTLEIADDPPGPPALEFALGFQGGEYAANYRVTTHAEFRALIAARHSGPVSFLREIQRCAFIQREPAAAAAPLSEFSAYLYGRYGGGVHGPYAHGYRAAFALIEPFVERVH